LIAVLYIDFDDNLVFMEITWRGATEIKSD